MNEGSYDGKMKERGTMLALRCHGADLTGGERQFYRLLRNAPIVGTCAICGGNVRKIVRGRVLRITVCEQCGTERPPLKRQRLDDERIVNIMRTVYERLCEQLGTTVLDGNAWLRVVQWTLGQSIPRQLWNRKGAEWLEQAGLMVVDGKVCSADSNANHQ